MRTNVTAGGKPGVWFFSLDATQPLAVRVARGLFHLAYLDARIEAAGTVTPSTTGAPHASRRRPGRAARALPADRAAVPSRPGTVEHFLTERYCLYAADRRGRLLRQEIDHDRGRCSRPRRTSSGAR